MTVRVVLFSAFLANFALSSEVSFRDVTVKYYTERHYHPLIETIPEASSLGEYLPKDPIKAIFIEDQYTLQVLYEDAISDLKRLKTLNLRRNAIAEVHPGAFSRLPKLQRIDLRSNHIGRIQEGVFNHLQIETLMLDENEITTIDTRAFDNMPQLNSIHLSDNNITKWDLNWFYNSPRLELLGLSNNLIQEIPPGAFENIRGVNGTDGIQIYLNGNKITKISHNIFGNTKRIRRLLLKSNEIENWDEDFFDGIKISHFNIGFNKLKCLKGDLANFFVAPETNIDNNPWDCNCITDITEFVKGHFNLDRFLLSMYEDTRDYQCKTGVYVGL